MSSAAAETLTAEMRTHWNERGYLLLEQVIPRDDADRFLAAADEVIAARGAAVPRKLGGGSYTIIHAVEHTAGLDELMDHPGTFPIILDLMGPYLQLMGTQIYVRPPGEHSGFNWHTDAGPSLQRIRVTDDSPPLNFKVQFFLTDHPRRGTAPNFCLVRGSHHHQFPEGGIPARGGSARRRATARQGQGT